MGEGEQRFGAAPTQDRAGTNADHTYARRLSRGTVAKLAAPTFSDEQLVIVALMVVAEFQVSRSFGQTFLGAYVLMFSAAANAQVTGWWRGGQLGLISSLAPAAM